MAVFLGCSALASAAETSSDGGPAETSSYQTVVTGQRGLAIGESALATSQISGAEAREVPARSTDEILRSIAEVELPRAGSTLEHPTSSTVSLRGVGEDRTLILMDGVPLNDAFGGWIYWNELPRSATDRIEVVRGASANLYGNLAMGGVIQLFSPPTDVDRIDGVAEYGLLDTYRAYAEGTDKVSDRLSITALGHAFRSNGTFVVPEGERGPVDIPEPFESHNAQLRVDYRPSEQLSGFASASYYDQAGNTGTALATNQTWIASGSGGIDYRPSDRTLWRLRLFGSDEKYQTVSTRLSAGHTLETVALQNEVPAGRLGGSLIWSEKISQRQVWTFGIDAQETAATNDDVDFSSSGTRTGTDSASARQLLGGVFGEWAFTPIPALTTTLGLRGDLLREYDGVGTNLAGQTSAPSNHPDGALNPKVTAIYRLSPALDLRGAGYGGFRAPTLNELYRGYIFGGVTYLPNSSLDPERLAGGELGVDWQPVRQLRFGLTGYLNDLRDLVETVTRTPTTSQRENIGQARSLGLEFDARWHPWRPLTFIATYALTDAHVVSAPGDAAIVGKQLPNTALHHAALTGLLQLPTLLDVTVRAWGESLAYTDDLNSLTLPSFALVDFTLSRRLDPVPVEIYASVTNLLDTQVIVNRTSVLTRIGLPRTGWLGARLTY